MNKLIIKRILFITLLYGIPAFALLLGLLTLSYLKVQNRNMEYLINEVNLSNKIEEINNLLNSDNFENLKKIDVLFQYKNTELNNINNSFTSDYNELNDIYKEKNIELSSLNIVLNYLQAENEKLNLEYESIKSHTINNVITINQYPAYPNGCELVALDILLKYYNVDVSVDDIIIATPIGKTPYYSNGVSYGGDPNYTFLGNPRSYSGWGIWDKGLESIANSFKPGVINGTGMEFDEVLKLVYNDRPVIVWTSINLYSPFVSKKWIVPETGETIYWKSYNHAVVVIGYNENEIIISDPINGKIRNMDRSRFINIYNFMDKRAIYY